MGLPPQDYHPFEEVILSDSFSGFLKLFSDFHKFSIRGKKIDLDVILRNSVWDGWAWDLHWFLMILFLWILLFLNVEL